MGVTEIPEVAGFAARRERALNTLRFLGALVAMNLKSSFALRGAFWLQAGFMVANNVLYFTFWWIFFDRFEEIRGWRIADMTEQIDQPFAQLIEDLKQRGMLDSTLIIWSGEFGRTPKINPQGGRDHFPRAFNVALAGGGVCGGLGFLLRTGLCANRRQPVHDGRSGRPDRWLRGGQAVARIGTRRQPYSPCWEQLRMAPEGVPRAQMPG